MTGEGRGKETPDCGNQLQINFKFFIVFCHITSILVKGIRLASELAVITPLRSVSTLQVQLFLFYSWGHKFSWDDFLPQHHKQLAEFELKPASVAYITKGCPCCATALYDLHLPMDLIV